MLFKFHLSQLNQKQVWILGSFYKDFTQTESHHLLLSDLYNKYPKVWIDEYQHV
jgi:HKD family nuclease